jgi:hypothetical protein
LFERKCGADLTLFFNGTEMSWCRTVLVRNCLFQRVPKCLGAELSFSTGAELSWCRTVFFNGCRTVLVPNCCFLLKQDQYFGILIHMTRSIYSQDSYQDYSCSPHYWWRLTFYSKWKVLAWAHNFPRGGFGTIKLV